MLTPLVGRCNRLLLYAAGATAAAAQAPDVHQSNSPGLFDIPTTTTRASAAKSSGLNTTSIFYSALLCKSQAASRSECWLLLPISCHYVQPYATSQRVAGKLCQPRTSGKRRRRARFSCNNRNTTQLATCGSLARFAPHPRNTCSGVGVGARRRHWPPIRGVRRSRARRELSGSKEAEQLLLLSVSLLLEEFAWPKSTTIAGKRARQLNAFLSCLASNY